jgi:hypothetical protein
MGTSDSAIYPSQSKFTIWNVKANRNFGEFVRFFQTSLNPNKFGSNLKEVFLPGFLIQIIFRITTCFQK